MTAGLPNSATIAAASVALAASCGWVVGMPKLRSSSLDSISVFIITKFPGCESRTWDVMLDDGPLEILVSVFQERRACLLQHLALVAVGSRYPIRMPLPLQRRRANGFQGLP